MSDIMINDKKQIRVGSSWVNLNRVDWKSFVAEDATNDFKTRFVVVDGVDAAIAYATPPPIPVLSADMLNILHDLKFWERKLASSSAIKYDWHACDRVVKYREMLKRGKRVCITCLDESDKYSPCGVCGTGLQQI